MCVCRPLGVLVTTGEHEYTRYGFRQLLEAPGACDVLQPDLTWMGGITEARRVIAIAASHDIPVVPHGSSVYSYHLQTAFTNCPMAEFLNLSKDGDQLVPYFGGLFPDEPLPDRGRIVLDAEKAGFGVTLKKEGLIRPVPRSEGEVEKQFKRNAEYFEGVTDREIRPLYPF